LAADEHVRVGVPLGHFRRVDHVRRGQVPHLVSAVAEQVGERLIGLDDPSVGTVDDDCQRHIIEQSPIHACVVNRFVHLTVPSSLCTGHLYAGRPVPTTREDDAYVSAPPRQIAEQEYREAARSNVDPNFPLIDISSMP